MHIEEKRSSYQVNIVPRQWYNFIYDHPTLINVGEIHNNYKTKKVNIAPKQPLSLMKQSFDTETPFIDIPNDLWLKYLTFRPTPLKRALNLENLLSVNAQIYYKYEGANVSGSHKLNTALAQVYYYKLAGAKHIITGTGAGQWGTAIAYACKLFGLKCTVFMVNISLSQKPQRKAMMELMGATVISSPSGYTKVGKNALNKNNKLGSLAIATAEAIEMSNQEKYTQFAVGSGENSVLLHQTIIGQEALNQLQKLDVFPDQVIACMGAGSNFAGIGLPLRMHANKFGKNCQLIAAEPVACPKLTRGKYTYEINDFSGTTPISKMYTLGQKFVAPAIHAGGLRYHGTSEFLSAMFHHKMFEASAIKQKEALQAGLLFMETEGILPAPESAHALAVAIQNAKKHPISDKPLNILVNISGHGLFDLAAYDQFQKNILDDDMPSEEMIKISLAELT